MENDLYINCFNRFANYLEKNNSKIRVNIENNKIWFCNNYQSGNNLYKLWSVYNFPSLKREIENFFFGDETSLSFFECLYYTDDLLKPFGKPSCIEELTIKMDLMGI